jgi:hypothetical protein
LTGGERGGEDLHDRVVLLSGLGCAKRGPGCEEVAVRFVEPDVADVLVADEEAVLERLVETGGTLRVRAA